MSSTEARDARRGDSSEAFASDVKAIRQSQRLTQTELAYQLGVEQATISRWENAKSDPTYDSVRAILNFAKKINFDIGKLATFWDESPEKSEHKIYAAQYTIPITDHADLYTYKLTRFDPNLGRTMRSPIDAGLSTVGLTAYLPLFRSECIGEMDSSVLLYNNDRSPCSEKSTGVLSVVCLGNRDRYLAKIYAAPGEKFHLTMPDGRTMRDQVVRWVERITHVMP